MDKLKFSITSPCDLDNIFYGLSNKYKGKTLSVFNIGVELLPYINDHCALYKYTIKDLVNDGKAIDHDLMRIKSSLPIIIITDYSYYGLIKDKLSIGGHQWQLFLMNDEPIDMQKVSTIVNTKEESAIYFDHSLLDIVDRNKFPILTDYKHYDNIIDDINKLDELDRLLMKVSDADKRFEIIDKINSYRRNINQKLYV